MWLEFWSDNLFILIHVLYENYRELKHNSSNTSAQSRHLCALKLWDINVSQDKVKRKRKKERTREKKNWFWAWVWI
jgi:hypothetical protein